ncbi:alpha/beta hydrolase [Streptomyces sp. NPDC005811]|uniref:alpha/beta fold hydrolase n=1 Tax=Streptomyces sp. NPDC005811 TaxID=3154565 RepID=UPI00340C1A59
MNPESKTFVLVAGAWAGGWAWNAVVRDLEQRGHRAIALTLPGSATGDDPATVSLGDAITFVASEIERRDLRDIVLVGHDVSGYPVTAVANRLADRIARVVYWSAFVPRAEESIFEGIPAEDTDMLKSGAAAYGGHAVLAPYARWQSSFVHTAPEPVQALTYSLLRPLPIAYMSERMTAADSAVPRLPVSYLVGTQDRSLPRNENWWTPKYTARLGVEPVLFEGTHAAHLLDPATVADLLETTSNP